MFILSIDQLIESQKPKTYAYSISVFFVYIILNVFCENETIYDSKKSYKNITAFKELLV